MRPVSASLADVINETGFIFDMGGVWRSYRVGNHLLSKITRIEYTLGTFDHCLHPSLLGTAQIVRKRMSKPKDSASLLLGDMHSNDDSGTVGKVDSASSFSADDVHSRLAETRGSSQYPH